VDSTDPSRGITITGLDAQSSYEVRLTNTQEPWTPFSADALGTKTLEFGSDHPYYDIRLPATATTPASFFVTVSLPLSVAPINFGEHTYGTTIDARGISIHNLTASPVALEAGAVTLEGANPASFILNAPGEQSVPASDAGGLNSACRWPWGGQPYGSGGREL
jgi:hypothetical protein